MIKRIFLTFLVVVTLLTDLMTSIGKAVTVYPVYRVLDVETERLPYPAPTTEAPSAEPLEQTPIFPSSTVPPASTSTSGISTPSETHSTPGVSTPSGISSDPLEISPPGIIVPPELAPTPEPSETATTPPAIEATTPPAIQGPLVLALPEQDINDSCAIAFQQDVEAMIKKAEKKSGIKGIYGVFVMDLVNEFYYGVNENLTVLDPQDQVPEGYFNSASVIKLFQGYIFCDMMRRGELDTEKTYFDKVTGRKFKLIPMIKSMISYSDNNYSNACLRLVDNRRSNEVLARLGIVNSRVYGEMSGAIGYSRQNNIAKYGTDKRCARITPADTGLILYNIYKNKDTDEYMKALNDALLRNVYNTRIPVGVNRVSSKYAIAHKTGTNSTIGVYNDAGIVYTPNPYILVVFTQGTTSTIGHTFIRSLAEQLTRYFEKERP